MSFLTFLNAALEQLAAKPASAESAEIARSALRMKALYAELDAPRIAAHRAIPRADARGKSSRLCLRAHRPPQPASRTGYD
jgi:hypothetical protein